MLRYEFNGRVFEFAPDRLQDFLAKYPGATEVEKTEDVAEPGAAVASETPAPASGVLSSVDTSLESQPRITGLAEVDTSEIDSDPLISKKDIARFAIAQQVANPRFAQSLSTLSSFAKGVVDIVDLAADVGEFALETGTPTGAAQYFAKRKAAQIMGLSEEEYDKQDPANLVDLSSLSNLFDAATIKYYDEEGKRADFMTLASEGKLDEAVGSFVDEAAGALPSLLTAMLPGGYALLGGGSFVQTLNKDLIERKDQTEEKIFANSLIYGAADAVGEFFGGRYFKGLLKPLRDKKATEIPDDIKDAMVGGLGSFIKKTFKGGSVEAMQEALTSIIQNASNDILYGDDVTLKRYATQALHSGLIGFALGSGMGGGITLKNRNEKSKFYEYIAPSSYKKQQHDFALKQEEAESDLENATENKKEYFQKRVDKIKQKRQDLKDKLFATYENASNEQIQYDLEKLQEQFDNVDIITGGDKYSRAAKNDAEKALKKAARDRESLFAATGLKIKGVDALNYKVTDAVAQQIKKRRDNLWFKAKDLKYEFVDTAEQYEKAIEKYGVDGASADGFFETTVDGKKKIFVNTNIASQTRAANVIGHELLHYAMSNRFAEDPEGMRESVIAFKDYVASIKGGDYILKSLEKRFIDGKYAKDGKISYDDDGLVIMNRPSDIEEYFNAFSDLIDGELIEAVEERSDGIKNKFRTMARGLGIGAKEVDFKNGQEIFDLLIDYNKNINAEGLLAARRQRKAVEAVAGKEIKPVGKTFRKKSMTAAEKANAEAQVRKLGAEGLLGENFVDQAKEFGEGIGKQMFDAEFDDIYKKIQNEGYLDNLIAAKYKGETVPIDFVKKVYSELTPHAKRFNPENKSADLFIWLNSQIGNKATQLYNREYKVDKTTAGRAKDIGERTEEGEVKVQVAAETDAALQRLEEEDISITAQIRAEKAEADPEATEKQSKFRRALGFETGGDIYNKVLDAASKSIRLAYRKTQDIKNTSERAIAIREAIRKEYFTKGLTSDLFKPIKNFLGAKPYIKNLKEHREAIVNAISTADFVQMERKIPDNERIFTVFDRKLTSKKDVQDAVNRDLLPLDALNKIDKGQAVNLYRKRMPTEAEFISFADQPAVNPITGARSGLKGTRKDGFAKAISNTLILDATMEVRQSEEVVDALDNDVSDLMELSAAIGREVDVKFSKSTAVVDINNAIDGNTSVAVYSQIRFSKSHREAYEARLTKRRNDLDEDQIKKAVNSIFKFVDGENIPNNKKSKYEKLAMHYMANGFLILPEDGYKVIEADRIATIKKIDPFSYKNPNELIERFVGEVKGARTNPDTVEEFTNKKTLSNGVTVYDVADSKEGQIAVRKVIDTHFGKKANPWCLAARQGEYYGSDQAYSEQERDQMVADQEAVGRSVQVEEFMEDGELVYELTITEKPDPNDMLNQSFKHWKNYNKEGNGFKIAFKNGKLLCFRDGNRKQWWDRNDKPSDKIHFIVKEKKGDVESTYSVTPEDGTKTLTKRIKGKMPTAEVFTLSEDVYFRRKFNTTFVNGLITKQKAEIVYKDSKLSTGIYIDAPGGAPDIQVSKITKDIETIDDRILTKEIEGKIVLASGPYKVYEDVDKVKIVHVTDVRTGETKSITVNDTEFKQDVKFSRSSAETALNNKVEVQKRKDTIKEGGLSTLDADNEVDAQAIYEDTVRSDEEVASVYKSVPDVKNALQKPEYKKIPKRADRLEQFAIDVWTESTSESDLIKVPIKERAEGIVPDVLLEIAGQPLGLETKADSYRTPARTIREEDGKLAISKRSKQKSYIGTKDGKPVNYIDTLIEQITPKVKSENEFINKIIGRKWKGSNDRMTEKEFNKYKASKKRAPIVGKTTSVTDFAAFDYIQMTGDKPIPSVYITTGSVGTMTMGNFNPFGLKVPAFEGKPMELVIRERWNKTKKGYTRTFVVEGQVRTNEKRNGKNVFKKSPISFFVKKDVNKIVKNFKEEPVSQKFSRSLSPEFNKMLQRTKGVGVEKTFSKVAARKRGKNVGKFRFFVPPSADDFAGLLRYFVGKGEQGNKDLEFFNEALIKPFARADEGMKKMRQRITDDYKTLRKTFPDVTKKLGNMIDDTGFTFDNAVRVYLWDKAGFEIPGLSKEDIKLLTNRVKTDQDLKNYAEVVSNIANQPEGYLEPGQQWEVESVASDLQNVVNKVGRKKFLGEWIENKNEIFSEENLNKIEATYGSNFREALENILWRMENGTNRAAGMGRIEGAWNNWINGSVGAIMFFNARSAVLQTLSTVNFINFEDNNIFAAAKAFANQKQYWKDFTFLFNSSFLKQRRAGLQTNINEAELASAVAGATNKAKAAIRYILKIGFTPTQVADSFAIASGGATYYRNRIKKYVKEGMDQKAAEKQAMLDFQEIAEETQQSARPDRISQQQASSLGRIILAFANTPMQYNRLIKKAAGDLVNKRGDWRSNVSRIIYYGALQNIIFSSLQSAIFALAFDDEEPEKDEIDKKTQRIINGTIDTLLRGSGIAGAVVSTIKNTALKFIEEDKDKRPEFERVLVEMMQVSPPIGSKARKIFGALKTYEYNRDVISEMGAFNLENPIYNITGNITSATLNLPLDRVFRKIDNMKEVFNQDNQTWQRIALALGWDQWSLGIDPYKDVKEAEKKLRKEKSKNKKKKSSLKGLKGLK